MAWSYLIVGALASRYRARSCAGTTRHVHVAVGHDPSSEMTVSFSSVRSFHVHPVGGVLIGTEPDNLNVYIEEQEPSRYYNSTPDQVRHGPYYSPLSHHIRITDLDPSTTYYYKCIVRKKHETYQMPNSASGAALRGNAQGSKSKYHDDNAQFNDEVVRAEERERSSDDAGEESDQDDDEDPRRQRRFLDLKYYDSTLGTCPPPEKIRKFQTAPKLGELDATKLSSAGGPSLRFAYMGDVGQFEHSQENIMHLVSHQGTSLNAITLAGDIAYSGFDPRRWDTFFDFMDDYFMIDEIPMHVVAGNHDIDKPEKEDDIFLAYETRFHMPQIKPAELGTYHGDDDGFLNMDKPPYPLPYEYGNAYYAFSYGISHHVFLNAYSSMEPESPQYQWLVQELQAVNRNITPWLIVTMHVPVYNAFNVHHHDFQIVAAKEHIEPLLVEHQVNLVVAGHIHAYQRTHNVNIDQLDPSGPMHVVVGAGGRQCKASFLSEEAEPVIAVRDATRYGYGILEIFNETHAQWEWVVTGNSGAFRGITLAVFSRVLPVLCSSLCSFLSVLRRISGVEHCE